MAKASRKTAIRPDQTKECPFCGETIKAVAIRCKHCHADLTAITPAPAVASPAAISAFSSVAPVSTADAPAALEAGQVLDLLTHLVDKSLVVYEETQNGKGRYRLLETVRQYSRERLMENEQALALLRPRHRDHFLALAEEAEPNLQGPEQRQWLNTLQSEHENLRAALDWCLEEEPDTEAGLRLAGALGWFWETRGHIQEGRERLAAALSRPGGQERTKARANALNEAGDLAIYQGDYSWARSLFEESLAIVRESSDKSGIAFVLNKLAYVAMLQGDYDRARTLLEESRALLQQSGERHALAQSLHGLGILAEYEGDYARARSLHEQVLGLFRELGDCHGVAWTLHGLGFLALCQKDFAHAVSLLTESLAMFCEVGYTAGQVRSLDRFANLALAQGQVTRATRLLGAADATREALGAQQPPSEREEHDGIIAAARSALEADAFAAAWAEGQAMSLEQAVEYALEGETDA